MKKFIKLMMIFILIAIYQPIKAQWTTLNSGTSQQLNSLFFLNADTGYVCGNTVILKTIDGENWTPTFNDSSMHIKSIQFPSNKIGYAISSYGKILKTINGGDSWEILPFDTIGTYSSVLFTSVDTGFMIGSFGMLLKTTNGAETWTAKNLHWHADLNSINFINHDTGYIVGGHKKVFITYNAGNDWETYSVNDYGWMMDVEFTTKEIGFIGKEGMLLKSNNGGKNWTKKIDCQSCSFRDIDFPNPNIGYITTGDSIYKSTDGGLSWNVQPGGFPNLILSIDFVNSELGYAVGVNGTILKTTTGGFLSTNEYEYDSKIDIFPSPVNDILTISNNSTLLHGYLTISNIKGVTVFESGFTEGINNYNISNLKSGIYIISLTSKSTKITRKIIKK